MPVGPRRRPRLPSTARPLVAALLALGVGAAPASALDLPRAGRSWIELRSPNFVYFSNAGEGTAKAIAHDLEELRAALAALTALELEANVPIYVYLFRDSAWFDPFRHLYRGRPAATSGYFISREHANYIAINGDRRFDAAGIVYHEYVHYFVAHNLRGLPLWFEEGLAELYQSFRVDGDTIQLGLPDPGHLMRLRTSSLIPLDELLAVGHDSPLYNESHRKSLFYAQTWALVHYLTVGSAERRQQTPHFLDLLLAGVDQRRAIAEAFGTDVAGLGAELQRYVARPLTYQHLEIEHRVSVEVTLTARRLGEADVAYRLGDLLAQQVPPRPEAAELFRTALAADPGHALSLAGLARVAELEARWQDASRLYEDAVRADPDNATVAFQAGSYLLRRGRDLLETQRLLRRAVDLAPDLGPAWVALTRANSALGDTGDAALTAAETAHRMVPEDEQTTLELLRLYLIAGRRGDAVSLGERTFQDAPDRLLEARVSVVLDDLRRCRDLLASGRPDDAERLIEAAAEVADRAGNPALITGDLALARSAIREYRVTQRYQRALELYASGDRAAARSILVELDAFDEGGRLGQGIRALLAAIDAPEAAPPDPDDARGQVSQQQLERLNDLLARGRLEEALSFLGELRRTTDPGGHGWIELKERELRLILDYNRFVDGYNLAVDRFNAGDHGGAAAVLERLLAEQPEAPQAEDARRLLEEARAAVGR